jgi:DNA repair exonuclease SbcCD ATPase subunit
MVDQEVEDILRQIRDSVRAEERMNLNAPTGPTSSNLDLSADTPAPQTYPNVSTMARAWDRLPPVMSNRSGVVASFELWLKSILKRGSRWFTWEQINFNAAVHHTVREMIGTLAVHEQQIGALKMQLEEAKAQLLQQSEAQKGEIRTLTRSITELTRVVAELRDRAALKPDLSKLETQFDSLATILTEERDRLVQQRAALQAHVSESLLEFQELNERTMDEQRVSFKQIALQINETSAEAERQQRALAQRVTQLENGPELSSKATGSGDL